MVTLRPPEDHSYSSLTKRCTCGSKFNRRTDWQTHIIDITRELAYSEGYQKGYDEGQADGYELGKEDA